MSGTEHSQDRAILFADVSDSSKLIAQLGDARAREVVQGAVDAARAAVEECSGRVVDQIGDEIFVVFPCADDAVGGAVGVHHGLERARKSGELPGDVRMRIGLASGPVVEEGGRLFGETVHLARRVASQAKPLQVLTTADTLEDVREPWQTRLVDRTHLKGQRGVHELREVLWNPDSTLAASVVFEALGAAAPTGVELRFGASSIVVDASRPSATLGRDRSCDLVVQGKRASRLHLRVERRKRSIWVVDQSTNGTLVSPTDGRGMFLRREEARLTGDGRLDFGPRAGDGEPVEYRVLTETT